MVCGGLGLGRLSGGGLLSNQPTGRESPRRTKALRGLDVRGLRIGDGAAPHDHRDLVPAKRRLLSIAGRHPTAGRRQLDGWQHERWRG